MRIFLVRTSLANELSLTLEGRRILRAIGNKIRLDEEPSFDRIVTSPSPPAVQTAELFSDRVDYIGEVEVLSQLGGGVPAQVIAPLLLARGETIAVVADEPDLSALGAFLVSRPTFPPLLHAQISVIEDRKPAWTLRPGEIARALLLVA